LLKEVIGESEETSAETSAARKGAFLGMYKNS